MAGGRTHPKGRGEEGGAGEAEGLLLTCRRHRGNQPPGWRPARRRQSVNEWMGRQGEGAGGGGVRPTQKDGTIACPLPGEQILFFDLEESVFAPQSQAFVSTGGRADYPSFDGGGLGPQHHSQNMGGGSRPASLPMPIHTETLAGQGRQGGVGEGMLRTRAALQVGRRAAPSLRGLSSTWIHLPGGITRGQNPPTYFFYKKTLLPGTPKRQNP